MSAHNFSSRVKQSGYLLFRVADLACYPVILIFLHVTNSPNILTFCWPKDLEGSPLARSIGSGPLVLRAWDGCPIAQNGYSPYDTRFELRPISPGDFMDSGSAVSGLYGPGAQTAWLLTILSVMATLISSKSPNDSNDFSKHTINADIITSVLYIIFASADLLHKTFFPKEFFKYSFDFDAAAQTVWTAIVLLLAVLALFRTSKRDIGLWQIVLYSTLWLCVLSHLLSRRWLLYDIRTFDITVYPESRLTFRYFIGDLKIWIRQPKTIFRFLFSIPMIFYFIFASKIRSNIWKSVVIAGFISFYTVIFNILPEILDTISRRDVILYPSNGLTSHFQLRPGYFLKVLRKAIPATTHSLTDLDQMAALVTTVVVLVWQWQMWRCPLTLAVKIRGTLWPHLLPDKTSVEGPVIDLESLPPRRTAVEEEV
jgi:hypothetical protein